MNKQEYIDYWLRSAAEDLDTIEYLLLGKRFVHALFFCHLFLEKHCKAIWIRNNVGNYPPKTHNLLSLLKASNVQLDDADMVFLLKINQYQIEGRYPEDIDHLNKITNHILANNYFEKTKAITQCILEKMQ